jgi:hypothetical protein
MLAGRAFWTLSGIAMPSTAAAATPLAFDTFWSWLSSHTRSGDCVIHFLIGKVLVGQIHLDPKQVLLVHASPDSDDPEAARWIFDCLTGPEDDAYTFCSFTMAHGMEQARNHQMVKH